MKTESFLLPALSFVFLVLSIQLHAQVSLFILQVTPATGTYTLATETATRALQRVQSACC